MSVAVDGDLERSLIRLHAEGRSFREIGTALGMKANSAWCIARRLGLPPRERRALRQPRLQPQLPPRVGAASVHYRGAWRAVIVRGGRSQMLPAAFPSSESAHRAARERIETQER